MDRCSVFSCLGQSISVEKVRELVSSLVGRYAERLLSLVFAFVTEDKSSIVVIDYEQALANVSLGRLIATAVEGKRLLLLRRYVPFNLERFRPLWILLVARWQQLEQLSNELSNRMPNVSRIRNFMSHCIRGTFPDWTLTAGGRA